MTVPPASLAAAVGVLVSRGEAVVPPGRDASLHPFVVPLTRGADGAVTGLLRWPTAGGGGAKLQVVRTAAGGQQLELLADNTDEFVARAAVDADAHGGPPATALAAAAVDGFAYEPGAAAASPGGVPGYLLTKVGTFVDVYEDLAAGHAEKGSAEAALITCERAQRAFQAWGHPYAYHARLLARLGRDEEARDLARHALGLPLWTLGDDLDAICELAQSSVPELAATLRMKAAGRLTEAELKMQNGEEKRTPQEIARDRASYLLDLVVAVPSEYSWEAVRGDLAALYREANLQSIGDFVNSTSNVETK